MSDKKVNSFFDNVEANIRQQAKAMGVSLAELAKSIEMTEPGFYKMLATDSIKLKTLIKISDVLKKPVTYFIDHDARIQAGHVAEDTTASPLAAEMQALYRAEKEALLKQIALLESQLKDKSRIIELLSR